MWLDKFIFCGRLVGPTCVYLSAAERLANGHWFPIGRYLLSSTYHLLHQVDASTGWTHRQLGRPLVVHQHVAQCPYAQMPAMGFLRIAIPIGHCWGPWTSRGWIGNALAPQLWWSHHSPSWDRCKWEPDSPILPNVLQRSFQGSSGLDALWRWRI
jgi:hypothetical protein